MTLWHYIRWRYDMARHWPTVISHMRERAVVGEVGTWKGASARRWLKQRPLVLYCIDPYRACDGAAWEARMTQAGMDAIYTRVSADLRKRGMVYMVRQPSPEASKDFPKQFFDLFYVDGDHSYRAVVKDMWAWWPKIRPGGIMVLDDHITGRWWGGDVIKAAENVEFGDEEWRVKAGRWLIIKKLGN